jgi:hypothetical protein
MIEIAENRGVASADVAGEPTLKYTKIFLQ